MRGREEKGGGRREGRREERGRGKEGGEGGKEKYTAVQHFRIQFHYFRLLVSLPKISFVHSYDMYSEYPGDTAEQLGSFYTPQTPQNAQWV